MKRCMLAVMAVFYVMTWNQYKEVWHWWGDEGYCKSTPLMDSSGKYAIGVTITEAGCERLGNQQGFYTVEDATFTKVVQGSWINSVPWEARNMRVEKVELSNGR